MLRHLSMLLLILLLALVRPACLSAQQAPPQCDVAMRNDWQNEAFEKARIPGRSTAKPTNTYIIPVVFHVVHMGGAENLPDTQVHRLLNQLNLKFANQAPYHEADGVDIGIQFCLAQRDTAGRATTGITHDSTLATDLALYITTMGLPSNYPVDSVISRRYQWNPQQYLNIYTIKYAHGKGGFATANGVFLVAEYLKATYPFDIIAHETGHYFGLSHTFDGVPCANGNCLTDNDGVCDTPPDNRTVSTVTCIDNSCHSDTADASANNPFRSISLGGLGDQNDDTRNYMDYSDCCVRFTAGQRTRMLAMLTTVRTSLTSSPGCLPPLSVAAVPETDLFSVGPNPLYQDLRITARQQGRYVVQILDYMGRFVTGQPLYSSCHIDLGVQPAGIYLYRILDGGQHLLRTGTLLKR